MFCFCISCILFGYVTCALVSITSNHKSMSISKQCPAIKTTLQNFCSCFAHPKMSNAISCEEAVRILYTNDVNSSWHPLHFLLSPSYQFKIKTKTCPNSSHPSSSSSSHLKSAPPNLIAPVATITDANEHFACINSCHPSSSSFVHLSYRATDHPSLLLPPTSTNPFTRRPTNKSITHLRS